MKTKQFVTVITALIAFITFAFGQEIKESIAVRLAGMKLRQLCTKEVIQKVVSSEHLASKAPEVRFHAAYYQAREGVYGTHFPGVTHEITEEDNYYLLRTTVVARMKELLHGGGSKKNLLLDAYAECAEDAKATFASLPADQRRKLKQKVEEAITAFGSMKNMETQKVFHRFLGITDTETYWMQVINCGLLQKNLSASETLRIAEELRGKSAIDTRAILHALASKQVPDVDLGSFAYRRWKEGGVILLNKYIALLKRVQSDIPE